MQGKGFSIEKQEIFENYSIPKAVMALAIPTVISQLITMIYNLADTFFIGQMENPYMVAAVSVVGPWFHILTAFGNLFGIGGSCIIARMLGAKEHVKCQRVSALAFYAALTVGIVYAAGSFLFMDTILRFLGASEDTIGFASEYLLWAVCMGTVPTLVGLVLSHFLRCEGYAKKASFGMMLGGILNVILDPVFIFVLDLGITGVGLATMLSNVVSCGYFLWIFYRMGNTSVMSFRPRDIGMYYLGGVISEGMASFLTATMASVSNMVIVRLSKNYSDIAVAAYGIVKKLDQVPLKAATGLCQGIMPLIGYNFGAKNYTRMKSVLWFSVKISLVFSGLCILLFQSIPYQIVYWFLPETATAVLGATLLRVACLAVPIQCINNLFSYTIQAIGEGKRSSRLIMLRHAVLNIPLLLMLDAFFGLFGMIWSRPLVELLLMPFFAIAYWSAMRKIPKDIKSD